MVQRNGVDLMFVAYACVRQAAINMPLAFNSCGQRRTEVAGETSGAGATPSGPGDGLAAPGFPELAFGNTWIGVNSGWVVENRLTTSRVSARVSVQTE